MHMSRFLYMIQTGRTRHVLCDRILMPRNAILIYRVYQKKVDPFKFKLSITNCSDCVKTQGFLLMGQNHFKIYGISIGYG